MVLFQYMKNTLLDKLIFWGNKIFLILPVFLFFLTIILFIIYGGFIDTYSIRNGMWKLCWHISFYFYLPWPFILFIKWLEAKEQGLRSFLTIYKRWFIGLICSAFSFAFAGLVIDLFNVIILLVAGNSR